MVNEGPTKLDEMSCRQQWAALSIRQMLANKLNKAPAFGFKSNVSQLARIEDVRPPPDENITEPTFRVGIIGAGVAGIFTGMLFDHLKDKYDLKVEYEILEANSEDRLGGRLYTYRFEKEDPNNNSKPSNHQYFDVGAMRFPDIKIMRRTFELFKTLGMEKNLTPQQTPPTIGSLVPYKLKGLNQPSSYNGNQYILRAMDYEPTAKDYKITELPIKISEISPEKTIAKSIEYWTNLHKDLTNGQEIDKEEGATTFWKCLIEERDQYTVRQYLSQVKGLDYDTIEFLETLNFGNRWYDQAFTEMVLESLDFGGPLQDWWCVEGGSNEIAQRMRKQLKQPNSITFNQRVTGLSFVNSDQAGHTQNKINVTVAKQKTTRKPYDAVFNSATLGAMQQMDLKGLNLNWGVKSAIRSLGYGASCKIGVRFKTLWWKRKGDENVWESDGVKHQLPFDLSIREGGQGKTDMPIRCCVYPSYNLYDSDDKQGVLLTSYTWSQEAERISALFNGQDNDELKTVVIHDLARLHAPQVDDDREKTEKNFEALKAFLYDQWVDSYAYDWSSDPTTVGAFAYFGPSQFQKMYPHITASDGKHIIIGEAASAHHAWVVGALESAVRGVYQFLYHHSEISLAARRAAEAYSNGEINDGLFGPLPAEYDTSTKDPDHIKDEGDEKIEKKGDEKKGDEKKGDKGDLARMQVLFETLRLKQGGDDLKPEKLTLNNLEPILGLMSKVPVAA